MMTVEEFARMQTADTEDYELVDGQLIPLASGNPLHCMIRDVAGDLLRAYFRSNPIGVAIGEVDCRLAEATVRKPDVSVFLGDRWKAIDRMKIPIPFAPDIAVYVLSPSESTIEVGRKSLDSLAAGTREVWLIDAPNGEILVRWPSGIRLLREADALESTLLPGFSVRVSELLSGL